MKAPVQKSKGSPITLYGRVLSHVLLKANLRNCFYLNALYLAREVTRPFVRC